MRICAQSHIWTRTCRIDLIHSRYHNAPTFGSNHKRFEVDPYLLDVVVAQGATILELLSGEDQTLLVRGNALLVLDLGLDVVDGVARLDVEGNGLTRQGLDETISSRISGISLIILRMLASSLVGSLKGCGIAGSRKFRMTYICTESRGKGNVSSSYSWGRRECVSTGFRARTGCEFSLVSAVGRCVRGGGGDYNLRISRLGEVGQPYLP